ncbi:MAG: PEGA domain-containing protein [Polyangiaceae bacterium]|nr:PEGA domain-containing protein [Polyangiaceae bacterium]
MIRVAAPSRRLRRLACSCVAAVAFASAPSLYAQDEADPVKEARKTFFQGIELEQAGNWAGALRMFRDVGQVKMTPQVRFHIAVCEENLGKLVAALGGYELALADADSVGEAFRTEVEEKIAALRERIPKLNIERGKGAEAATIELDGIVLGASSVGVDVSVDPGPHLIAARSPGHEEFSTTVDVAERAVETVTVTLKKVPTTAKPVDRGGAMSNGRPHTEKKFPVVPVALLGGGGVLLVGAGAALIMRSVAMSDWRSLCPQLECDAEYQYDENELTTIEQSRTRAQTYGIVAPVLAIAGVGSAGTGVFLLVRESRRAKQRSESITSPPRAMVVVTPEVGSRSVGLTLSGVF